MRWTKKNASNLVVARGRRWDSISGTFVRTYGWPADRLLRALPLLRATSCERAGHVFIDSILELNATLLKGHFHSFAHARARMTVIV